MEAALNGAGPSFTEIKTVVLNWSAWPARSTDKLSYRSFFTLEPRVTAQQIGVSTTFSQCVPGSVTGPHPWIGDTYFVEVKCLGTPIFPGGWGEHKKDIQVRLPSTGTGR